ncbi:MAG: hypothetical protein CMI52_03475 [Parcubacteria group bacterium]|nr:hypothetical protein [Parcubacteria group bacterium]|tara:strand:- start:527 stop:853 length:327 start_codon:yes stop_codon:yes gene_type:complete
MNNDRFGPPWENVPGLNVKERVVIRLLRKCGPSDAKRLWDAHDEEISKIQLHVFLKTLVFIGIVTCEFDNKNTGGHIYTLDEHALELWAKDRIRHLEIEGRFVLRNKT